MRADDIPEAESGLWKIERIHMDDEAACANSIVRTENVRKTNPMAGDRHVTPGTYTVLWRHHGGTVHRQYGDCVMDDTGPELSTHLNFAMRARGRVVVTGLGLGCVVRGLLHNPAVTHVNVIERDSRILRMVGPHLPSDSRLVITKEDAFDFAETCAERYDYAWHDIWSDPDLGERELPALHMELLKKYARFCGRQGLWGMPRRVIKELRRRFNCWYH
jgi:hypothetical protein